MKYQRVQLRVEPISLLEGDKKHPISHYFDTIEEAVKEVREKYQYFTVGIIVMGDKGKDKQYNRTIFDQALSTKCKLIVGFDFEQFGPEDSFGPLQQYDDIL